MDFNIERFKADVLEYIDGNGFDLTALSNINRVRYIACEVVTDLTRLYLDSNASSVAEFNKALKTVKSLKHSDLVYVLESYARLWYSKAETSTKVKLSVNETQLVKECTNDKAIALIKDLLSDMLDRQGAVKLLKFADNHNSSMDKVDSIKALDACKSIASFYEMSDSIDYIKLYLFINQPIYQLKHRNPAIRLFFYLWQPSKGGSGKSVLLRALIQAYEGLGSMNRTKDDVYSEGFNDLCLSHDLITCVEELSQFTPKQYALLKQYTTADTFLYNAKYKAKVDFEINTSLYHAGNFAPEIVFNSEASNQRRLCALECLGDGKRVKNTPLSYLVELIKIVIANFDKDTFVKCKDAFDMVVETQQGSADYRVKNLFTNTYLKLNNNDYSSLVSGGFELNRFIHTCSTKASKMLSNEEITQLHGYFSKSCNDFTVRKEKGRGKHYVKFKDANVYFSYSQTDKDDVLFDIDSSIVTEFNLSDVHEIIEHFGINVRAGNGETWLFDTWGKDDDFAQLYSDMFGD